MNRRGKAQNEAEADIWSGILPKNRTFFADIYYIGYNYNYLISQRVNMIFKDDEKYFDRINKIDHTIRVSNP